MNGFFADTPAWLIFPILSAAAVLAWWLYNDKKAFAEAPPALRQVMRFLRFAILAIVLVLLLLPVIKLKFTNTEKAKILILADNSSSVAAGINKNFTAEKVQAIYKQTAELLGNEFETKLVSFDASANTNAEPDFKGTATNIAAGLEYAVDYFFGKSSGAVVLLTDGIFNRGFNPVFELNKLTVPVFTVPIGDTATHRDLAIKQLNTNKKATKGTLFPIKIRLTGNLCTGSTTELKILLKGKKVFSKEIAINSNRFFENLLVEIPAEDIGLQKYSVVFEPIEKEIGNENNYKDFLIEITEESEKILLLSDGPHPDLGAINKALSENTLYKTEISNLRDFKGKLSDYKCIITYGMPSVANFNQSLVQQVFKFDVPVLAILGSGTAITAFNKLNTGISITANRLVTEFVQPEANGVFDLFASESSFNDFAANLPPLVAMYGEYTTSPLVEVFAWQKISSVITNKPLIAFVAETPEKSRSGFILAEGIWRWRIQDYKTNASHVNFDKMINKMVQYLTANKNKERFVVETETLVEEAVDIEFSAEVYNKSFEKITTAEPTLTITDSVGKEFVYSFMPQGNNYKINAGKFTSGTYRWNASVTLDGETFGKKGMITVKKLNIENEQLTVDLPLLYQIADQTGGKMYMPEQITELRDELLKHNALKPAVFEQTSFYNWIEFRWLTAILLILIAAEQVLRKFYGNY